MAQAASSGEEAPEQPQGSEKKSGTEQKLSSLSELTEAEKRGNICVQVSSVGAATSSKKSGWQYRRLQIRDASLAAELLIAEAKFQEWHFRPGDHLVCSVKSNGVDPEGKLSFFFGEFLGPFDTAKLLYLLHSEQEERQKSSSGRMKPSETVYQISAREVKSLLELIRLWILESKPQHYTKWCQMHQIVATNLFYMGLVKRTASMSGYYYPTREALEFFSGRAKFPKKKVFVKSAAGAHVLLGDDGDYRSFTEYLEDYADRQSALAEYHAALGAFEPKIKAILEERKDEDEAEATRG